MPHLRQILTGTPNSSCSGLSREEGLEENKKGKEERTLRRRNNDNKKTNSTPRQQKTLNKRPRFHCSSVLMVADNKQLPTPGPARPVTAVPQARGEGAPFPWPLWLPKHPFPCQSLLQGGGSPSFREEEQQGLLCCWTPPAAGGMELESPAPGSDPPISDPEDAPSPKPPALGVITT